LYLELLRDLPIGMDVGPVLRSTLVPPSMLKASRSCLLRCESKRWRFQSCLSKILCQYI
jgi:hypothetical protein